MLLVTDFRYPRYFGLIGKQSLSTLITPLCTFTQVYTFKIVVVSCYFSSVFNSVGNVWYDSITLVRADRIARFFSLCFYIHVPCMHAKGRLKLLA